MSKELKYGNKDLFIEKFEQKTSELRLLAKGGNAEVLYQSIQKDEYVIVEPGEDSLMEFFFIVSGEIVLNNPGKENTKLGAGSYFYAYKIDETVGFSTITDVEILYFSSEPVFHYISKSLHELIQLATKVEEKDEYTVGHIKRVGKYAIEIGKRLNFSAERLEILGYAAMIHDLGKVNVPDEILNKPGRLTDDEFNVIKAHSLDGAKMVDKTYYENMSNIISQHHERIDGSGYPYGLKGNEICQEAKIIAVADTFDAMTTNRPYRKRFPIEVALEELIKCSGTQFQEEIVNVFVNYVEEAINKENLEEYVISTQFKAREV